MSLIMDIGTPVRYPRTGTVGTIVRIEERNGFSFAELDSTGMLYRADMLVPATLVEKLGRTEDRAEEILMVEKERADSRDNGFMELPNLDSACNGAG